MKVAVAAVEIAYYEEHHHSVNLMHKAPFIRLVKHIVQRINRSEYRFQKDALDALQEAGETYLVGVFEMGTITAAHAKRVTVKPDDMQLVRQLWNRIPSIDPY